MDVDDRLFEGEKCVGYNVQLAVGNYAFRLWDGIAPPNPLNPSQQGDRPDVTGKYSAKGKCIVVCLQ